MHRSFTSPGYFASAFVVFGLVWIISTDWFVATFFPNIDAQLQTVKGIVFVLVGGGFFYILVVAYQKREQVAHRRFQALVENSSEMIAVLDADEEVRYRSPGYERTLGYGREKCRSTEAFSWVHPRDLDHVRVTFFDNPPPPGETSSTVEFRMQGQDGSWHVCEGTVTNLLDDRAIRGLVLNARDVTERVAIQEKLERAGRLEILGQTAGGIAHDFGNLLQIIKGCASLTKERLGADDPSREHLDQIMQTSEKGEAFIGKLLTLSRRETAEPVEIEISEAVDEMLGLTRHALPSSIELRTALEEDLPVHLDPGELEQVLLNLVMNSKDAMPEGGTLWVETERRYLPRPAIQEDVIVPAGEYVMLRVRDTGRGMEESTRRRVFEPFFTTKTGEGENGTGLGLATVFSIVEDWGGFVTVESQPNEGTTFEIAIPGQREPQDAGGDL